MEVDQIQCKFPKISNGGYASSTIVSQREKMNDEEEEEGENRRRNPNKGGSGAAADPVVGLYGWPTSRIVRVSRATGGKDRHSKDRLGYDQPSKAVEWLLAAAAGSIAELPPMNSPFPRPSEEESVSAAHRRMVPRPSEEATTVGKSSIGSSSSETSKGSGRSIARSEKAKERENEKSSYVASFTELLSGGGINCFNGGGGGGKDVVSVCRDQRPIDNENSNFFLKFPMDYFSSGLSAPPATASPGPLLFSAAAELQPPFSFASDHSVSAVNTANSSAVNRGTLQSNSSSPPPSLHFPPNYLGGAAEAAGNHRHFFPGFDSRLQLYYGDAQGNDDRHSGQKRKTHKP